MSYAMSFASVTATMMHALLYFRKQILGAEQAFDVPADRRPRAFDVQA